MNNKYKITMISCFIGYIVQAIINNFVPLLFLTFQKSYGISLSKITLLITVNFIVQLAVDLFATLFVDKIGYRISIIGAHIFGALGLILLTVLPKIMEPYTGILISVILYAIGGGLIEVLISPLMESCPTDNKEKAMSLLHSFYCWGHVGVILISTIFFQVWGIEHWRILAVLWAIIPLVNGCIFIKAPMVSLISEDEQGMSLKELFGNKIFWLILAMMVCAGASEQSMSQWASLFAEKALGISKTLGDLAGPMAFAIFMGSARAIYGKYGDKIDLGKFMAGSGVLCVVCYLTIVCIPSPMINLVACAICGFSVGIMWPGTYSSATGILKNGGTAMFAIMALAGDLGCAGGPTLVGMVSNALGNNMKLGIMVAIIFPVMFLVDLIRCSKSKKTLLD